MLNFIFHQLGFDGGSIEINGLLSLRIKINSLSMCSVQLRIPNVSCCGCQTFHWPLAPKTSHLGESFVFESPHIFKSRSLKLCLPPFPSTFTSCSRLLGFFVITSFLKFSPSVLFYFLLCFPQFYPYFTYFGSKISSSGLFLEHNLILGLPAQNYS